MNIEVILQWLGGLSLSVATIALAALGLVKFVARNFAATSLEKAKSDFQKDVENAKSQLQKDLEKHKYNIRRDEFLFEKQYLAVTHFMEMKRQLFPRENRPDFDMADAMEHFAVDEVGKLEGKLFDYLERHQAVLPDTIITKTEWIASCAREGQMHWIALDGAGHYVARMDTLNEVAELWKELECLEKDLRELIWQRTPKPETDSNAPLKGQKCLTDDPL